MGRFETGSILIFFGALWTVFFFSSSATLAKGNVNIGKLRIEPGISYKVEYHDNIFYDHTMPEDDFIHTFTPAINFTYDGSNPDTFIHAGYNVDVAVYETHAETNYERHNPWIALAFKASKGFYIKVYDSFVATDDPYGDRNEFRLGASQTERWHNLANATMGYEFGKFALEALYKNFLINHTLAKDQWQDRRDHVYGGTLLFKVKPKILFFVQYRRTDAEYGEQNNGIAMAQFGQTGTFTSSNSWDYYLNDYFAGVRFAKGGKLGGEIKLGYGDKNFKNKQDLNGNNFKAENSFLAETNLSFQASPETSLNLHLNAAQLGSPELNIPSYKDYQLGVRFLQAFFSRFSFNFDLLWNHQDHQNAGTGQPDKYFSVYSFTGGIGYTVQDWLFSRLEYTYSTKEASNATYADDEYEINIVALSLSVLF